MQKVAIITGASHGIGLATAKLLVEEGWKVFNISRSDCKLDNVLSFKADVNDNDMIPKIFEEIFAKEGRIDAVINNAGFGIAGAIEETKPENVDAIIKTNLSSVIKICSLAVGYLKLSKGKIINISSVAGIIPLSYQACYSASKAAVENFSRALSNELKPFGIKVTAVLPGDTKTDFTKARIIDSQKDSSNFERMTRSINKMAKDEQNGKSPKTVAKVVLKILKQKNPPLRKTVGFISKLEIFLTRICSTKFINFIVRKLYG